MGLGAMPHSGSRKADCPTPTPAQFIQYFKDMNDRLVSLSSPKMSSGCDLHQLSQAITYAIIPTF